MASRSALHSDGDLIRTLRTQRNLSKEELAAAAGVSSTTIDNLEHERKPTTVATLTKLAVALGLGEDEWETLVRIDGDESSYDTVLVFTIDSKNYKSEEEAFQVFLPIMKRLFGKVKSIEWKYGSIVGTIATEWQRVRQAAADDWKEEFGRYGLIRIEVFHDGRTYVIHISASESIYFGHAAEYWFAKKDNWSAKQVALGDVFASVYLYAIRTARQYPEYEQISPAEVLTGVMNAIESASSPFVVHGETAEVLTDPYAAVGLRADFLEWLESVTRQTLTRANRKVVRKEPAPLLSRDIPKAITQLFDQMTGVTEEIKKLSIEEQKLLLLRLIGVEKYHGAELLHLSPAAVKASFNRLVERMCDVLDSLAVK